MVASAQPCGCDYGCKPIPHICADHRTPSGAGRTWIGVDLDGTLAEDCKEPADVWRIGAPIPAMVDHVKALQADGKEIRILTARVAGCGQISSIAWDNQDFVDYQRALIEDWCLQVFGVVFTVTASKDFQMITFYDDRCIRVETNTGRIL